MKLNDASKTFLDRRDFLAELRRRGQASVTVAGAYGALIRPMSAEINNLYLTS
ncbi:MAG: hypothetical protein HY552_01395 [Elusimicrobia bacterium]|nr:hypothetical protein [Elusimicrobiota bacterium]